MTEIPITLPAADTEVLRLEIAELTRRWGIGPVNIAGEGGDQLVIGRGDSRVVIPHHDLSCDLPRWRVEAVALLSTLPAAEELLADPEGAVAGFFEQGDSGTITSHFDVPGILYGLLTRREELLSTARDAHGRWEPESSLLHDWLQVPAVDLIARGIGAVVARVLGLQPPSDEPPWQIALTFDIDFAGQRLRSVPRETWRSLRARGPVGAARAMGKGLATIVRPSSNPAIDFDAIADRLEDMRLRGLFFPQALHRSRWDDYELNRQPALIRALRRLRTRGHHVGLHGSYATADHGPQLVRAQRDRIARLIGGPVDRYRAHYLRTRTPEEEARCLEPAGMLEDWSIGYSKCEGFRLGTAHPVASMSGIILQPLHVMDVTLRFHRGYSAEVALATAIRLLGRVKAVGGTASILWHPHNLGGPLWPTPWPEVPWELALWALENGAQDAFGEGVSTDDRITQIAS